MNSSHETERDGSTADWTLPLSTYVSDCSVSHVSAAEKRDESPIPLQPAPDVAAQFVLVISSWSYHSTPKIMHLVYQFVPMPHIYFLMLRVFSLCARVY